MTLSAARLLPLAAVLLSACGPKSEAPVPGNPAPPATTPAAGLTLPAGFIATIFADSIGQARHIAVAPNGDVYLNTWRSPYDTGKAVPSGGYVVALRDTNQDGRADRIERFGSTHEEGSHGGTGLVLAGNTLFVESDSTILRFHLEPASLAPTAKPDVIVTGLTTGGEHPQHSVVVNREGRLLVTVGSATNSCQEKNRQQESKGARPCPELLTRAGVWQYDTARTLQHFTSKDRYATGLRNAIGIALNPADSQVYAVVHGRDDLWGNWPKLYNQKTGAELPAETMVKLTFRGDYGWPYCYYDPTAKALLQNPEYGGDAKEVGDCARRVAPVSAYPAHWAPNGLAWYTGASFPASYQGGAFIAFHGSWNRAPEPQGGYNVVFQPFKDGQPSGEYQVFADGFAGVKMEPNTAAHRPVGVAMGPDGSVYVTDDVAGRVWKISYHQK